MRKNNTKQLEDWISIAATIQKIYQDLAKDKINHQEEKYQSDLEMLKMCIDLENKIYQSLGVTVANLEDYYQQIEQLVQQKKYSFQKKEAIWNRLDRYLLTLEFLNPFLSMQEDINMNELENEIAIEIQFDTEYLKHFFFRIKEELNQAKTKREKERIIHCYYDTLFEFKLSEHLLANPRVLKDFTLSEREKCLLFYQNPYEVNEYYRSQSNHWIDEIIQQIFDKNFSIKSIKGIKAKINLEVILSILTKEEASNFLHQIYRNFLNNPNYNGNSVIKEKLNFLSTTIGEFYQNSISVSNMSKVRTLS